MRRRSSSARRYSVASRYAGSSSITTVSAPAPATNDSVALAMDWNQLSAAPSNPEFLEHSAAAAGGKRSSSRNARRRSERDATGCEHRSRMNASRPERLCSKNSGLNGDVVTTFSGRGWRITPGCAARISARRRAKSEKRRVTCIVSLENRDDMVVAARTPYAA